MEPAKSEIKIPGACAPAGLRLKETGFLFQRLRDWEGVGETPASGAGEGKEVVAFSVWIHCLWRFSLYFNPHRIIA